MRKISKRFFTPAFFLLAFHCMLFTVYAQTTGSVKGKVRNSRGAGISGVTVTARQDSKDVKSAKSNDKGEFTINGLEPGVYNFIFDADGYGSAIRYNIPVRSNNTTDLGDRLTMIVDKGTLVIVQGSVFFKDGTSVTGAKVQVEKVNSDGTTNSLPTVWTNIYGEFTFRRPAGTAKYRVTAKYQGRSATKEIEVGSAAVYRMAISLDFSREDK